MVESAKTAARPGHVCEAGVTAGLGIGSSKLADPDRISQGLSGTRPGLQTSLQTYWLAGVDLLWRRSGSQNPESVVAQGFSTCVHML